MPDILLILIVLLIVVIIWRGPKTLPLLGRAFGQGVKEARKEMDGMKEDISAEKAPAQAAATAPDESPKPPA
jgi:TatA/E family protein of Tat protein translocase